MKLHRNLVQAVVACLHAVFVEKHLADRSLDTLLRSNPRWGARDRAFIAETTYEIVRFYRLLAFAISPQASNGGVINDDGFWQLIAAYFIKNNISLPDWEEFKEINTPEIEQKLAEAQHIPAIRESVPDWLNELGTQELGNRWANELKALNEPAPVILRVNTLKTKREQLQNLLLLDGIETEIVANAPDALRLMKRKNVLNSLHFKMGMFEIQDGGSQQIAPFLDIKPSMHVIDACAGAGGKTLHIASLMQNKGSILAMDIEHHKLKELQKRATRNHVSIIQTILISAETLEQNKEKADRLLLDVPCSGTGVLRRKPDAKWRLSLHFIEQIKQTQAQILREYSKMLKEGGKMVYATCSLLPSENEQQIEVFLKENKGKYTLEDQHHQSPYENNTDGFFMARLVKM